MAENTGLKPYLVTEHQNMVKGGKIGDMNHAPMSEKDYLEKARWIYSMYCYGNTMVQPDLTIRGRTVQTLRSYGKGSQDVSKYRNLLLGKERVDGSDPEAERHFNYQGISWDPVKLPTKFRALALEKITSPNYDPTIVATDSIAGSERALVIARDKLNVRPEMQALSQMTGAEAPVTPMVQQLGGDVDAAVSIGSYLLPVEAFFQDAVKVTMEKSKWDQLQVMIAEDLLDLGCYAIDTKINPHTKQLELKYVDPAGLICPASKYPDCNDVPWIGYVEYKSIHELRGYVEIEESRWFQCAKRYGSYNPNIGMRNGAPLFNDTSFRDTYLAEKGRQVYDPFTTVVLTCYFKEAEKIDGVWVQMVYSCKWIVGTDIVFDCKKESGIARKGEPGNMSCLLPMVVYFTSGPSFIEKVIADIDDLQIATYKLRALIAAIPPGERRVIDLSGLTPSLKIGNKSYDMLDLLAIERKSGTLILQSEGLYGEETSTRSPITPIQSRLFEDIAIYQTMINNAVSNIRSVTGMNEVVDGTAKTQDMLIGVMQGMERASNSALVFDFEATKAAYVNTAEVVARRYHSLLVYGDIKFTSIRMTPSGLYSFSLTREMAFNTIDIICVPLPSQQEIDFMRQQIVAKVQENKLDQASAIVATQFLAQRNIKAATIFMAKAIEAFEKRTAEQQAANFRIQAEQQAALSQQQSQNEQQVLQVEYQLKIEFEKQKTQLEIQKMKEAQRIGIAAKAFEIEAGRNAIS